MILHLGVDNDIPELSGASTHEVGSILEAKYGLFSAYYENRKEVITEHIANSIVGALEDMQLGAPAGDMFGAAGAAISEDFRNFLNDSTIETLGIPGVPTKAALNGVQSAKKKKRGPRRPSFIDTGILRKDFKAWVD